MGIDRHAVEAATTRLSRPALAPLVDVLVARFEDGVPSTVSLRGLDGDALFAVADLLGAARGPAPTSRISVRRLLATLDLVDTEHLRAALESIRGPIDDRRARRAVAAAERASLWSWFEAEVERLEGIDGIDLTGWASRVQAGGIRDGVTRHRQRLEAAVNVLGRLPAEGTTLAALAADVLGDPHGLDRGRSVAALVIDALDSSGSPSSRDAETTRDLWERAGVAPDALSSVVLTLGLRAPKGHALAAYLHLCADSSEPAVLTLAQLRRWPLTPLDPDAVAYIVENPSVLAEAARRGWNGKPPLVCSSGRPTVATLSLTRQLGSQGGAICQHADFDSTGVAITGWLTDRAGTRPWRMSAQDYLDTVATISDPVPLTGKVPPTPWDPRLAEAMTEIGAAAYEEQARAVLLDAM